MVKTTKIRKLLLAVMTASILAITTIPSVSMASNSMSTVSITTDTLEALPSCLKYKIVGVCFWLVCGFGCSIETTPKVDHYLPDVVDTVYPKYGSDPWPVVNHTIDLAGHAAGSAVFKTTDGYEMKSGNFNSAGSHDSDIKLKEVDVVGNPALAILHWHYLLNGQATPMVPYYQSQLDASAWRSGLLEQLYPQSWIPAYEDVGTFLVNDWGSTYPRAGFLMQDNIGKAGAVLAVRGGNIATTESFDHIHKDLDSNACPEEDCTTAGPILSQAPKIEWQMLLPNEQDSCTDRIDTSAHPIWTKDQKLDQSYSWIVWREYRGCINGDGTYLGSVG